MRKEVTLNPGHQKTIVFSVIPNVVSEYDVSIGSLNNQFNAICRLAALYGKVTDADSVDIPVVGAIITIIGTGGSYYGTTDIGGEYYISNIEPGMYSGEITHPNYETYII